MSASACNCIAGRGGQGLSLPDLRSKPQPRHMPSDRGAASCPGASLHPSMPHLHHGIDLLVHSQQTLRLLLIFEIVLCSHLLSQGRQATNAGCHLQWAMPAL